MSIYENILQILKLVLQWDKYFEKTLGNLIVAVELTLKNQHFWEFDQNLKLSIGKL